jgi:hypothetical protein
MAVERNTAGLILFQSMRLYGTLRPGVGGKRFTRHTLRHRHIASLIRRNSQLKYISVVNVVVWLFVLSSAGSVAVCIIKCL